MDQTSTTPDRRTSLAQQLVNDFSRRIREGEIKPGEKLPTEQVIIQAKGVSRTVVREAMSRLQAEGLVETRHGIGTFVVDASRPNDFQVDEHTSGSLRDAIAVIELRLSLEVESSALAAKRRTPEQLQAIRSALDTLNACPAGSDTTLADFEFHHQISLCTANSFFTDVMEQLGSSIIPRSRVQTSNANPEDYVEALRREHEQIFAAIAHQDCDAARAAMRLHLSNSLDRLRHAQYPAG